MVFLNTMLDRAKNDYTYSKLGIELARDIEEKSLLVKEHMWRWVSGFKFSRKESEDTCGTHRERKQGVSRDWEIRKLVKLKKKT